MKRYERFVGLQSVGLVVHHEYEGNANGSAGTNHGMSYGDPTYGVGVLGQAINLDGDGDYVNCGKASSFDLADQITVAAWIKVTRFDKKYQTIIAKGDSRDGTDYRDVTDSMARGRRQPRNASKKFWLTNRC